MSANALNPAYRIYVVEDSPILLQLLLELLGSIPRALVVGHSGRAADALVGILNSMPDAIIVDLMLKSGTGFDVLHAVGRHVANPPVALVLTNLATAPYRKLAARLGAAHFFDKSADIPQMVRVISKLAEEHRQRRGSNRRHG